MRFLLAVSLLVVLGACASKPQIPYDVTMTVTPIGGLSEDGPQQYLLESSYVEFSEDADFTPVIMPKLIALEGQDVTVFVGQTTPEGDSGTECQMCVTRNEDIASVQLCFRTLEQGTQTRLVRQLITVPVSAMSK